MSDVAFVCGVVSIYFCIMLSILVGGICGIIMTVYGSICINKDDYTECNGSETGAILLVVFGVILILCCCCGGITINCFCHSKKNNNSS